MNKKPFLSRRSFISSCFGVGTLLVNPALAMCADSKRHYPTLDMLNTTISSFNRKSGGFHHPECHQNMSYAYHSIQPSTFTELALVVWAGTKFEDITPYIDEYCRRRRGGPAKWFDHSVLNLDNWHVPNTQRVLVFREQLERLTQELTWKNLAYDIYRHEKCAHHCSLEEFRDQLRPEYKETLSRTDEEVLYRYIATMYGPSLTYTMCASISEQAMTGKVVFEYDEKSTAF